MSKVVWILGAGFSVPLGGPTLQSLLSDSAGEEIRFAFHGHPGLYDTNAQITRRLYQYGTNFRNGAQNPQDKHRGGEHIWSDPEVFLDYLDTAVRAGEDSATWKRMQFILGRIADGRANVSPQIASAVGRRLIAAECCRFLHESDTRSERWEPYRSWSAQMGADDTIVSFNYDRVIECMESTSIEAVVPGSPRVLGTSSKAQLLKLHGSVDWKRSKETFERSSNPLFALSCADDELCIATPGPTKHDTAAQLADIWSLAEESLTCADVIVFIGYRFPPSDAEARSRLLRAIELNTGKPLRIHIVLGDDRWSSDRLMHLLRFVCGRAGRQFQTSPAERYFNVVVHPLFSQDFLTVWSRETLVL